MQAKSVAMPGRNRWARWARMNLRVTVFVVIGAGVISWLFGADAQEATTGLPYRYFRAAILLVDSGAYRGLSLFTFLGWLYLRRKSDDEQRVFALLAMPFILIPQLVVGCIFLVDEPDMNVPGLALLLALYLTIALILFGLRPRDDETA